MHVYFASGQLLRSLYKWALELGLLRRISGKLRIPLLRFGLEIFKMSSWNLLGEHLVQLLIRASCSLRLVDVEVDQTEDCQSSEDKGHLGPKVRIIGVEKVRENEGPNHVENVLKRKTNSDSFPTKSRRGHLL